MYNSRISEQKNKIAFKIKSRQRLGFAGIGILSLLAVGTDITCKHYTNEVKKIESNDIPAIENEIKTIKNNTTIPATTNKVNFLKPNFKGETKSVFVAGNLFARRRGDNYEVHKNSIEKKLKCEPMKCGSTINLPSEAQSEKIDWIEPEKDTKLHDWLKTQLKETEIPIVDWPSITEEGTLDNIITNGIKAAPVASNHNIQKPAPGHPREAYAAYLTSLWAIVHHEKMSNSFNDVLKSYMPLIFINRGVNTPDLTLVSKTNTNTTESLEEYQKETSTKTIMMEKEYMISKEEKAKNSIQKYIIEYRKKSRLFSIIFRISDVALIAFILSIFPSILKFKKISKGLFVERPKQELVCETKKS